MAIQRAKRTEIACGDGLPAWVRIGASWDIGIGEPLFLDPGEHTLEPAEDSLFRILFGTLDLRANDGVHGLDAGWMLLAEHGDSLALRVRTRTQLRRFSRARIEAAHRLWTAYGRCSPPEAPVPLSALRGQLVAQQIPDLLGAIPDNGAVLLGNAQGALSQVLAALPAQALPTLTLQRPYQGPACPEAMAFHDGGEAHLRVVEALAVAGLTLGREELFLRSGDGVFRWVSGEDPSSPHLLEALAELLPRTASTLRETLQTQQRLDPVLRALVTSFPLLAVPWWPVALVSPLADEVARAWDIGRIHLSASLREQPLGEGDFEVVPGAVDGLFRTCAILIGPASTVDRLVVDVECAAEHEMAVHRHWLERGQGEVVVTAERCIVQVD